MFAQPGVVLRRVQLRHHDLAVLAAGAGDADHAVAGSAVAGHHAAGRDGLVVGMGVDGQQGMGGGHGPDCALSGRFRCGGARPGGRRTRRGRARRAVGVDREADLLARAAPGGDPERGRIVGQRLQDRGRVERQGARPWPAGAAAHPRATRPARPRRAPRGSGPGTGGRRPARRRAGASASVRGGSAGDERRQDRDALVAQHAPRAARGASDRGHAWTATRWRARWRPPRPGTLNGRSTRSRGCRRRACGGRDSADPRACARRAPGPADQSGSVKDGRCISASVRPDEHLRAAARAAVLAALEREPAGQVAHVGLELTAGRDAVERHDGRLGRAVAVLHRGIARHPARHAAGIGLERRGVHAQRRQDLLVEVGGVRAAAHARDHLAQQAEGEVAVLQGAVRGDHDGRLRQRREDLVAGREPGLRPAGGRRLGDQPGAMGEHPAQRHLAAQAAPFPGRRELRQVPLQRIVERQPPLVAELEDGRGGERLGDGRDARQRIDRGRLRPVQGGATHAMPPGDARRRRRRPATTRGHVGAEPGAFGELGEARGIERGRHGPECSQRGTADDGSVGGDARVRDQAREQDGTRSPDRG